ncbi:hypothetical protein OAG68_00785 [bacterium]|nr:hypothetical protein [bacterium]
MRNNLLLPVLLAGAIGLPYLISQNTEENPASEQSNSQLQQSNFSMPVFSASTSFPPQPNGQAPFGTPNFSQPAGSSNWGQQASVPASFAGYPSKVVLPGTANSPDFAAAPMEFLPTTNLAEIIRFDINPDWIKQRWPRVSMTPQDDNLHGMRVALVTGTNPSDLHGSLTYHFDRNQSLQRVSFQGWTGDASRLVNLLTQQYDFKQKPSHLAGLYASSSWGREKGALLMQHPDVIRSDTPTQQMGIVLEINNPNGSFSLSPYVQGILAAASN